MRWKNPLCSLNLSPDDARIARAPDCPNRRRLARATRRLQNIQFARNLLKNPAFGRVAEERIIWRELLDLELQLVDEELQHMEELRHRDERVDQGKSYASGVTV